MGWVAAVILATAAPAYAQETTPPAGYGQSQPAAPVGPAAPPGYAQSAAYLQYLQYMALMSYAAGASGAAPAPSGSAAPPAVPDWFTNGAQMTSVPSSGPGSAYFTNGAEVTAYPTAQPSAPPVAYPPPAASVSSAQPPPPPVAPSASAEPAPAPTLTARASAGPQGGIPWIQATPVPENVNTYLAPSEVSPPVAIKRPSTAATGPSDSEGVPRATLLIPSDREGAPFRSGGTLALILAALVTGMLVGGMAVVRFRSRGAAPPPG